MKLRLFHYWRSSSSWRVRFALELKGVECEYTAINLLSDDSDGPEHVERNPMGYVPVLEFQGAPATGAAQGGAPYRYLTESMAIIEWLDETYPKTHPLLPGDTFARARFRALAELINAGTQPLGNLSVTERHSADPLEKKLWNQYWYRKGLRAYEESVRPLAGRYSVGDDITLPDLFLVPQCYAALRNEIALEEFPLVAKLYANLNATEACQKSHPDRFK